jgi:hypothetical protein
MFNKRVRPESPTERRVRMEREHMRARDQYLVTARAILFNATRLRQERLSRAAVKLGLMALRARA